MTCYTKVKVRPLKFKNIFLGSFLLTAILAPRSFDLPYALERPSSSPSSSLWSSCSVSSSIPSCVQLRLLALSFLGEKKQCAHQNKC